MKGTGRRVLVAMSGGVDSSAAVYLLREQGYDCVGATMELYGTPAETLEDARAAAERMGIPHHVLPLCREFEERVELVGEKLPALELVRRAAYGKVGKITKTDLMELCPTLSKSSVETSIKKLVEQGELLMHGKGPSTFYTRNDS